MTVGNLALAQMEQGNYEGAEASLTRALKNDDEDAFSLSLIGTLRYRQKKYDERLPQAFFSSGGLELAIVKFGQEVILL